MVAAFVGQGGVFVVGGVREGNFPGKKETPREEGPTKSQQRSSVLVPFLRGCVFRFDVFAGFPWTGRGCTRCG